MRLRLIQFLASVAVVVAVVLGAVGSLESADARGATCSDYDNQAAAQRAADTRDPDGDGVYCESLPCPCLKPGSGGAPPPPAIPRSRCRLPRGVVRLRFSERRYPNIRAHTADAIRSGWPRVMVVNRRGADARRDQLLSGIPTRRGYDRDEYPAAVGRGKANGKSKALIRGRAPRGWRADVAYVPSRENRSHGSSLGAKLRPYCNGTKFRYVFR